ncbi:MAG: hypothetical protein J3K34DRAFT_428167 [Monoraphidium minutum]|nr:MAG: hypothetical protein J3K34DRAFT_428167 [Monoraphidium minutum]
MNCAVLVPLSVLALAGATAGACFRNSPFFKATRTHGVRRDPGASGPVGTPPPGQPTAPARGSAGAANPLSKSCKTDGDTCLVPSLRASRAAAHLHAHAARMALACCSRHQVSLSPCNKPQPRTAVL